MANQLGMAEQQTILLPARRGWSHRRIARELGIHQETVARYVALSQCEPAPRHPPPEIIPKPAISITGSEASAAETRSWVPFGDAYGTDLHLSLRVRTSSIIMGPTFWSVGKMRQTGKSVPQYFAESDSCPRRWAKKNSSRSWGPMIFAPCGPNAFSSFQFRVSS